MSNINVTEGSGKTVATETIGGVEYGLVKLIDSTAASTTRLGADAGLFLVSAKQADAGLLRISGVVDSGSISAKSSGADTFLVSAKQGDAGLLRISGIQGDAGLQLISAKSSDGTNLRTSAVQSDASLQRVSASLFPDTTGGLTIAQSLSVSAIQTVKSSAGALYGYYMFNKDTKVNFVKLYNLSGGAQIGTDTPVLTVPLPISGGANAWFGNGLAGFTAGIQMGATSGLPIDNTAAPAASAVIVDLFYK